MRLQESFRPWLPSSLDCFIAKNALHLGDSMCGRYTLTVQEPELAEEFDISLGDCPYFVRYNIAPTQNVPVIRIVEGQRQLRPLRWGLVPHWAKDLKIGSRMINARSEEAASKPAFRSALRKQRCLVPCTGFFEWKAVADGSKKPRKQPYYIRRRDNRVFGLAGVWERWKAPDGALVESYSILTTSPNELVRSLHDRMPVILRRDDYDLWLDPAMQDASRLNPVFTPFAPTEMVATPVSTEVNSPTHDTPGCIQEVA